MAFPDSLPDDDVVTLGKILRVSVFIHNNTSDLFDANIAYSSQNTGLLARLEAQEAATPGSVQIMLDKIGGLGGISYADLKELLYPSIAPIRDAAETYRVQLSAAWKIRI